MHRVLLTDPIHPDAEILLRGFAEPVLLPDADHATLYRLAAETDGIIVRRNLPDDIFARAPRVKAAVRHGAGVDMIPLDGAHAAGVTVANVPGINARAVAEFAIACLQHLRRPVAALDARLRQSSWDEARALSGGFSLLEGTTLGIVGLGSVGVQVARIANGFGMKVVSPQRARPLPEGVDAIDLDALFAASDHIVLSCPLNAETLGLVSRDRLQRMKPTGVLINVARGPVVDTAALIEALTQGRIAGASTDVYDVQPLPADSPLRDCPHLLLTPHCAGSVPSVVRDLSLAAVDEMQRVLAGQPPRNPIRLSK
ncbi:hydroxyacid dehydrogenase [Ancylobacter sp. A5.8]|uniref:NAD(P)-dependent oxidoreductase n=1 Tax=Ancylobacter gelatini TaxID=2919920 RepID=UPI001F4D3BC5|nr:NAD(P)-dependent oxidoreductase [Ancylobacter gelatini]MCJ8144029.1 hydroxyacid dehydrogenase [Ancylobacter gelatini]